MAILRIHDRHSSGYYQTSAQYRSIRARARSELVGLEIRPVLKHCRKLRTKMTETARLDFAKDGASLLPAFKLDRLLNQDQAGRRIALYGTICGLQAIVLIERAAFSSAALDISILPRTLHSIKNLGFNDIYSWFLASSHAQPFYTDPKQPAPADLKINVICPCTSEHVKKYSQQGVRVVTETPEIYEGHVRPFMQQKREEGRLNWVFNIIEGRTEQEDVVYREGGQEEGFLMLPDLNWDRKTLTSLHLLALVERRDIWSVRDLRKSHITWVKHMRAKILDATVKLYPEIERDQLKLYVHYQPTYYHFHVHIVHVALEAGTTQATGKALGLENVISQLETMIGGEDAGMKDVCLTYQLGEASELWQKVFLPLKKEASAKGDGNNAS